MVLSTDFGAAMHFPMIQHSIKSKRHNGGTRIVCFCVESRVRSEWLGQHHTIPTHLHTHTYVGVSRTAACPLFSVLIRGSTHSVWKPRMGAQWVKSSTDNVLFLHAWQSKMWFLTSDCVDSVGVICSLALIAMCRLVLPM